jgi:hypothetical protein
MKKKLPIYFIVILGLIASCITPISDFPQITSKSFLTIETALTDQTEVNYVKMTYSSSSIKINFIQPVRKAKVYVIDDKGIRENFIESSLPTQEGTYFPSPNFKGKTGSTYTLTIETTDGKKYVSQAETMPSVPEIQEPTAQFEVRNNYDITDVSRVGFNVYINLQDSPKKGEYYQWYWKHYEKVSICHTCTNGKFSYKFGRCIVVDPPDPNGGDIILPPTYNYYCDGQCWNITTGADINILADTYINGELVSGKKIARIPYDGKNPYYFRLEQRGITKAAFEYQQGIVEQLQNSGTFFDVPAETRFNTNIKSLTNPEDKVLGIFNVYSFKKQILYIKRDKGVPVQEKPVPIVYAGEIFSCDGFDPTCKDRTPCEESSSRTKIKPEGWVD